MRKPTTALAMTLLLWLSPQALAGDRSSHPRTSSDRGASTAQTTDARPVATRLTWLRHISLALGLVTPAQPVFVSYGISDVPDPTSSRDRGRRPGFGRSKGGPTPPKDPTGGSAPSGAGTATELSFTAR